MHACINCVLLILLQNSRKTAVTRVKVAPISSYANVILGPDLQKKILRFIIKLSEVYPNRLEIMTYDVLRFFSGIS